MPLHLLASHSKFRLFFVVFRSSNSGIVDNLLWIEDNQIQEINFTQSISLLTTIHTYKVKLKSRKYALRSLKWLLGRLYTETLFFVVLMLSVYYSDLDNILLKDGEFQKQIV